VGFPAHDILGDARVLDFLRDVLPSMYNVSMNHLRLSIAPLLLLALASVGTSPGQTQSSGSSGEYAGWATNGPAVYRLTVHSTQVLPGPAVSFSQPPSQLPMEIRRAMLMFRAAANVTIITNADRVFDQFLPESLNNAVWTNFVAQSKGKTMVVWSVRAHPPGWPARAPQLQWNPNGLMMGMKGVTALSPCWQEEGNPGQVPITALTKRHGYTRGHSMGPDQFSKGFAGEKVWFLTEQNKIVETTVARTVVRTRETSGRDYSILLFSSDLPDSIQPMRVVPEKEVFGYSPMKYVHCYGAPCPIFRTEQTGHVSADVPGFTMDTLKGGDSASPNMLPLPGELVFWTGRSTSGASPEMQADMDQLCRLEGLDPRKYQLQWVDLSAYPSY
jgi:hypothetical protein